MIVARHDERIDTRSTVKVRPFRLGPGAIGFWRNFLIVLSLGTGPGDEVKQFWVTTKSEASARKLCAKLRRKLAKPSRGPRADFVSVERWLRRFIRGRMIQG